MLAWRPWVSLRVLCRSLFAENRARIGEERGETQDLEMLLDTRGLTWMLTCLSYVCMSVSMSMFGRMKRCSTILCPACWTPPFPCLHTAHTFTLYLVLCVCRRSSLLKGNKGNVTYILFHTLMLRCYYIFNVTGAVDNNVTLIMCLSYGPLSLNANPGQT